MAKKMAVCSRPFVSLTHFLLEVGWGTRKGSKWLHRDHLKSSEKANAAENGHSQGGDDVRHGEGHLQNGGDHHKEVEAVEEGDEVKGEAEGIHLEEHLEGEENDEEEVRRLLELAQPIRLAEMLSCQNLTKSWKTFNLGDS